MFVCKTKNQLTQQQKEIVYEKVGRSNAGMTSNTNGHSNEMFDQELQTNAHLQQITYFTVYCYAV